jgi:glycosyltransferase involved in cell wall biosynthesis
MIVAHIGPPLGRGGGPAGYLAQLASAADAHGAGAHQLLFPARVPARPAGAVPDRWQQALAIARRVRHTLGGAPVGCRPPAAELVRAGGALDGTIGRAWAGVQDETAPSLERALDAGADVMFAHDAPSAEAALDGRDGAQQVWLLLHNPMPLALYLAWCWGVPERAWEEVASFPDVRRWTARELGVLDRVDRLLIPCADALVELTRAAAGFARVLDRVDTLMTGASGPRPSLTPIEARRRWGLPLDRPVGLFLGNPQPYRGLDALLAGVERLPRRGPRGVVAVAGCPVERVPFGSRLRALGPVAGVGDLLRAVDFVVNVNRFSLFDLSTIEAAEAGLPLLLHDIGGNRTFASLGAGVVPLASLDPALIADELVQMFALSPEERARLGASSRACYERHLTPRHLLDRHLALYDGARAAVGAVP